MKWYRTAANQGFSEAQYSLGVIYTNGEGVPEDYAEAVKWYRLAAKQGEVKAQHNLALMYHNGFGVPQDDLWAHMWLTIASGQGNKSSDEVRGIIAESMTSADISEAQKMARECLNSKYQNCGFLSFKTHRNRNNPCQATNIKKPRSFIRNSVLKAASTSLKTPLAYE